MTTHSEPGTTSKPAGFSERHGLYRSRHGWILGVCRGLAAYFDAPVWLIRLAAVMLLLFSGFWPALGLYILAAVFLKPEPMLEPQGAQEGSFYDTYARNPGQAFKGLKERFDKLERRTRRLEDAATSRERDWDRRLRDGR